uniref:Uncharacterized protein n=1 Tax=Peduovirinae sp. ctGB41 TaxID=2825070 RepID=A0A8S5QD93_9CAUD|nr:MAG TPA: hypothetical protein [Peduovirinae sp. ctGB41]DAL23569.1 MAG TPA_asm: hypothetical protein [Caudoviricetes sp.]
MPGVTPWSCLFCLQIQILSIFLSEMIERWACNHDYICTKNNIR